MCTKGDIPNHPTADEQAPDRDIANKDQSNAASDEYCRRREQEKILSLFGTIDYDDHYDYKAERSRKRMPTLDS
jgi:hypothetical protein